MSTETEASNVVVAVEQTPKHFHLIAGTVMYGDPAAPEAESVGALTFNCTIFSDDQNVPSRQIARAQQGLQMTFFQKTGNPDLQVFDIIILSVSYLGYMTEEDFMAPPEGMKLQEANMDRDLN